MAVPDRTGTQSLDDVVARLARRHPGLVVGLLEDGRSMVAASGRTELPDGPTPAATTLFEIGSITKVFTALLLADAVVRHELTLDQPLRDLLPAGAAVPEREGVPITLRHLATHTSGLPRSPFTRRAQWRALRHNRANPFAVLTVDDLLEKLGRTRLRRTPGSGGTHYSNLGAALLGVALVRGLGAVDYEQLVRDRICDPLGLRDTVVVPDADQAAREAAGHTWSRRPTAHWTLPAAAGAGALRSTANDLLTFLQAQLELDGPLAEAMRLTQREQISRRRSGIGLGWHRLRARTGVVLWHNGGTGGFRSIAAFMPDRNRAVVALANSQRGPDLAAFRLLEAR